MNRELNTTFVFSTHDEMVVDITDQIVRLQDGLIVENSKRNSRTGNGTLSAGTATKGHSRAQATRDRTGTDGGTGMTR